MRKNQRNLRFESLENRENCENIENRSECLFLKKSQIDPIFLINIILKTVTNEKDNFLICSHHFWYSVPRSFPKPRRENSNFAVCNLVGGPAKCDSREGMLIPILSSSLPFSPPPHTFIYLPIHHSRTQYKPS